MNKLKYFLLILLVSLLLLDSFGSALSPKKKATAARKKKNAAIRKAKQEVIDKAAKAAKAKVDPNDPSKATVNLDRAAAAAAGANVQVGAGGGVQYVDAKRFQEDEPSPDVHEVDFESPRMWRTWSLVIGHRLGASWLNMTVPLVADTDMFCAGFEHRHRNVSYKEYEAPFHETERTLVDWTDRINNAIEASKRELANEEKKEQDDADLQWLRDATLWPSHTYAIAHSWTQQFPVFWSFQYDVVCDAFNNALDELPSEISDEESKAVLYYVRNGIKFERKKQQQRQITEKFLAENALQSDVVVLPDTGVQYRVLRSGDQSGSTPRPRDTLRFHVLAEKKDSKRPLFDTNGKRALEKRVDEILPGLRYALLEMRVGDRWQVYIPPEHAYKDGFGLGKKVYPYDLLIYTVELLEIIEGDDDVHNDVEETKQKEDL